MRKTPDKNSALMCPVLIEKERFQKNMQRERDAREKERRERDTREKQKEVRQVTKVSANRFDCLDEEDPVKLLVKPVKYNKYDIYGKLIATPAVKKIEFPELSAAVIAKHVATVWNKKLSVDEETKEEPEVKEIVSYEEEEVFIRILPSIPVPGQRPNWADEYSSDEEEEEDECETHFNDHLATYFEERNVTPAYFDN